MGVSKYLDVRSHGSSGLVDRLENSVGAALVGTSEYPVELRFYLESMGRRKPGSDSVQTEIRLRPLDRRALRTWRPPLVAIRARKPWVRARFIVLG